MGLEEQLPSGIVLTTVENLAGYMRKGSLWPATFGLACCAIEMMAVGAGRYDLARFGMEVFRPSPRQADLMIVAGRVSNKMAPVLRQVYDQMAAPKWVISMGACASSGGMFNNYALESGEYTQDESSAPKAVAAPVAAPAVVKIEAKPAVDNTAGVGSSMELFEKMSGQSSDAPLCMTCGTKMRMAGSCFVCEGCGNTSGCS